MSSENKSVKKKRLLIVVLSILLCLILIGVIIAVCVTQIGPKHDSHTHVYDKQIVAEKYLVSSATCTEKAVYHYSCSCGEAGSQTFEYGEEPSGHRYEQQVIAAKYLVSEATCTKKAVYYYSCSCGEAGTETFEYDKPLGHSFTESNYKYNDDATFDEDGTKTAKCDRCDETDTVVAEGTALKNIRYTVKFEDYDNSIIDVQEIGIYGNVLAPENPTRDGYKFDGWYTKAVGGEKIELNSDVPYNPEKNQILYAHWTANEIEFISNGATNGVMPNVSYESVMAESGSGRYQINSPYRREYEVAFIDKAFIDKNQGFESESGTLIYYLAGWMDSDGKLYEKDAVIDLTNEHFGKITLTALWVQEPMLEHPTWAKNGYEDTVVWYADSGFTSQSLIEKNSDILGHTPIDGVYNLYAKFTPIKYQVRFMCEDDETLSGFVDTAGTDKFNSVEDPYVFNEHATATKPGKTHVGWVDDFNHFYSVAENSIGAILGLTEQNHIVTLRPVFGDAQHYSITYHLSDKGILDGHNEAGMYVEYYTVNSGVEIRNATYSTYPLFNRFVGWYLDEACTEPFIDGDYDFEQHPENIDLYPKWDLCMEYKTVPAQISSGTVSSEVSSRVIIDLSCHSTTNLSKRLKISNTITELIIIGNGEVFTNFSMYLDGFVNAGLDIRLIDFKFKSNVDTAIGFSECQNENLTIYAIGDCSIESSCSGGSIIGTSSDRANNLTINVVDSIDMIAGDGYNAVGGDGDNGGTAIWANNLQLNVEGNISIHGGNGGNGKAGVSYGIKTTGNSTARSGGNGGNGGNGGSGINATGVSIVLEYLGSVEIFAGNGGVGANGGKGEGAYYDGAEKAGNGGNGGNGGSGGCAVELAAIDNLSITADDLSDIQMSGGKGAQGGSGGRGGDAYEEVYSGDGGYAGNNGDAGKVIYADNKNYAVSGTTYTNGELTLTLSNGGNCGDAHNGYAGTSHATDYGAQGSKMEIELLYI